MHTEMAADTDVGAVKAWAGREQQRGTGEKDGEHVCSLTREKTDLHQGGSSLGHDHLRWQGRHAGLRAGRVARPPRPPSSPCELDSVLRTSLLGQIPISVKMGE